MQASDHPIGVSSQHPFEILTEAGQLSIYSDSAFDDNTTPPDATGARTIEITGVDTSFNPLSQSVSLNGVTPVLTTSSDWLGINSLVVTGAGDEGEGNTGLILVADADPYGEVYGAINPGGNIGNIMLRFVATGKQLQLRRVHFRVSLAHGTGSTSLTIVVMRADSTGLRIPILVIEMDPSTSTTATVEFSVPEVIPAQHIVAAMVMSVTGSIASLTGRIGFVEHTL